MTLAVVFSGQGNQHPEMLTWLPEDALPNQPAWREALRDPAWARVNAHAQPLITATALAAWTAIEARLRAASVDVVGVAGYSVGELAACAAAGIFDTQEALRLATRRAAVMDDAARVKPGALCGVTGIGRADLNALLRAAALGDATLGDSAVAIAIRNGEDSVVVGGPVHALEQVEAAATAKGARCTRLAVSVASHTPSMRSAAEAFDLELRSVSMRAPMLPLFDSDGQRVWTTDQVHRGLARQIATTVRWDEVMDQLAARGPSCVLEIGGGQALARLWQQRHPNIPARSADEFRTLDGVLAWIDRCAH